MPALFLYLLQVSLGIALLYLVYRGLLRQTTFHQLNRWFLLVGLVLCGAFPLLDVQLPFEQSPHLYQVLYQYSPTAWHTAPASAPTAPGFEVWPLLMVLYWAGAGLLGLRFLVQLVSLLNIHRGSTSATFQGIAYRKVEAPVPPFSFGRAIYFYPPQHPPQDWLPILHHERTHAQQGHTLDILLIELTTLFLWFNPFVWLLRNALKENLEFLTDQQTLRAGLDRKQYQFSLLQTAGASPFSLSSSFSYHSLKHRIMMMNKAPSASVQHLRFLAALPLLFLGLFACQGIPSSSQEIDDVLAQEGSARLFPAQDPYHAFLQRNPHVQRIYWSSGSIFVQLKSGQKEQYPSTPEGVASAEKKYGSLPPGPPPPPPPAPAAPLAVLAPPPPPPPFNTVLPAEFKKRNPSVQGLSSDEGSLHVIYQSGEVESFDQTAQGRAAFEKKFGPLPLQPVRSEKLPKAPKGKN
ncbi:M56 family metallopeptidase [Rufibacter psychrotolerans]|uniref:M56 family metallopeptidase n=1 Tax=Rufibacter psychrotolerans TaxID=2812556 RepID=UPI00196811BD|nr:M56 family metallopeptidase [Rufibacter sp. SYSU D00308]